MTGLQNCCFHMQVPTIRSAKIMDIPFLVALHIIRCAGTFGRFFAYIIAISIHILNRSGWVEICVVIGITLIKGDSLLLGTTTEKGFFHKLVSKYVCR